MSIVGCISSVALFVWVMRRVAPNAARSGRFRASYLLRCLVTLPLPLYFILKMQLQGQMSLYRAILDETLVLIGFLVLFQVGGARIDRKLRSFPPKRTP